MALSREARLLQNKWRTGTSWPKRLEWIELTGIRGWSGQRVDFGFPVVALVGENGSGKSTVLQASAAVYRSDNDLYASDFFPDTPFERITSAVIRFSYREGQNSQVKTVRKPTDRWRGNPERPVRPVEYIDLSRIQPVSARVGYSKLLKAGVSEGAHVPFDQAKLLRLTQIVGKQYANAGISVTSADARRQIPVLEANGARYSGFHQGVGEIAAAELLASDYRRYGIVLIDEIETSLHPRAQRRLIRDLCHIAREKELQIILTTHSPYILSELPPEARVYLMDGADGKTVVTGVSPEFAMTRMDEEQHPECDVYVEDPRASTLVSEVLASVARDTLSRVKIIPYGSASVGNALGQMAHQNRFPRPSIVFLDADQAPAQGCHLLPGEDAPEQFIFRDLQQRHWEGVSSRIGRNSSETIDALNRSMDLGDHHLWVYDAADRLVIGGDILWQAICSVWANSIATQEQKDAIVLPVQEVLDSA
ncbi:TPA: AAA family ATPase [Pseudomonas aeruginosa]|uniref:ATP-dependent nuclease n=1 Tax=Pseudomonas aeruginosa TaxID=287 RepID=UPI0003B9E63C|nr:AAA family ATPase [Pseudomonas aeruginosa]ERW72399.1 hypothetical protein Q026_01148 [Pseudomonas aeruginosa BWHPSA013]MCO2564150.1 AAA family ATPase [Pseudomonas aeruginosa]MCO2720777.1 AAA family ATPase [Pseudomonas aeruginosa]MDN3765188.1 AAA family ATPase [Pseudomonas aeruginosa]MDV6741780.1 AAA family ATPase [Pseudomonas aeruginosa]